MLEKSSQFLSSEQRREPKSLDVAVNIAGVEKIPLENGKLVVIAVNLDAIWFEFRMTEAWKFAPFPQ